MTDHNPLRHARALVLAGPALALLFTVFALFSRSGLGLLEGVWFGAALWSFLTAFSCVLWRGFHDGDWSSLHTP